LEGQLEFLVACLLFGSDHGILDGFNALFRKTFQAETSPKLHGLWRHLFGDVFQEFGLLFL